MEQVLDILLVEDNEDDAVQLTRHIRRGGFDARTRRVDNAADMRRELEADSWDIVFCDMLLPGFDPLAALKILSENAPDVPLVAMSGVVAEDKLVETIKAGAYDFVRKDNPNRVGNIIERALQDKKLREEKKAAQTLLDESESRFRSLVGMLPDAIVIYDESGRIIFVNNRSITLLRANDAADLLGKHFESFVPASDLMEFRRRFDLVMQTEACFSTIEQTGIAVDGTRIPVETSAAKIQWFGRPAFLAMLRDITARKEALAQIRRSEARASAVLQNVADGVIIIDEAGRIKTFNRAAEEMFGYPFDEVAGRDVTCLMPNDMARHHQSFVQRFISSGAGKIIGRSGRELPGRHKDGDVFPLEATVSEAFVDGQRLFIGALRDITERKRAEAEKEQLENQLRHTQKLEALGTLSGGIAHEFNNVLLPIRGLVELSLETVEDRPDVHARLKRALANAERASALIEKILTFSRVDNCALERTKILAAVEDAVSLLEATIPPTVDIRKELEDIGELYIDKAQFSQIVMNLGVNAMHAIGAAVGRIEFTLKTETVDCNRMTAAGPLPTGAYARLCVRDTGCGIDKETIGRIFEPFFTTKQIGEGTGMGLPFVLGVVRNHGGAIDVESMPGEGTTFSVFIPFGHEERQGAVPPVAA